MVRHIKTIRVCQECIEADACAEVNGLTAVLDLREKFRVGSEGASAERDEGRTPCFSFSIVVLYIIVHLLV